MLSVHDAAWSRRMTRIRAVVTGPYGVTAASIGAAALGNVVCYKLVAVLGSPQSVSDYSAARRYLTFALPLVGLGVGVALPLRSAMRPDRDESRRILYAQFTGAATLVLLALGAVVWGPSAWVEVTGLSQRDVVAILATVFAFNCTGMLYAYHRGYQDFRQGAWLVVLANGVFPSTGALLVTRGASAALWIWAALCLGLATVTVVRLGWPGWGRVYDVPTFLRSSLGRMPGDLAYSAVFLVPVAQMQGVGDPARESVFNYFFIILGIITAAAAPISSVLLPVVGASVARDGVRSVGRLLALAVCAGAAVGLLMWSVLSFVPSIVLNVFMNHEFSPYADVLSSLAPAAVGMSLFVFVRSVLDGMRETPMSAVVSLVGLAAYSLTRMATPGPQESSIVVASNVAFTVLGLGTLLFASLTFWRGSKASLTVTPDVRGLL